MHVLDFLIYFPVIMIYWYLLHLLSGGEFTTEMGALVGWFFGFIVTIIYIILFGVLKYNWIDIFRSIDFDIYFKL